MMDDLKKELWIIGIIIVAGLAFLVSTGYLVFSPSFSFAVQPSVVISKSPYSPTGSIGNNTGGNALATFDAKTRFTGNEPVILQQITFDVELDPHSSQPQNGLANFVLYYNICRPQKTYGYGYGYGYPPQNVCSFYYAFPVSVTNDKKGDQVTFAPGFLLSENATEQRITLSGNVFYTGLTARKNAQRVRALIHDGKKNIAFSLGSLTPRDLKRVSLLNTRGNWLTINPGYGYPRTR